jgi:hypothetical protein
MRGNGVEICRLIIFGATTGEIVRIARAVGQSVAQPYSEVVNGDTSTRVRVPSLRTLMALSTIRSFRAGDEAEQTETLLQLQRGLDEERPEGQRLFILGRCTEGRFSDRRRQDD